MTARRSFALLAFSLLAVAGCESSDDRAAPAVDSPVAAAPAPLPATYASYQRIDVPVTLPVLDAFLADSAFAVHATERLQITAAELDSLRAAARADVAALREPAVGADYEGTTWAARERAATRLNAILGQQRATDLMAMVRYYWSDAATIGDSMLPAPLDSARMLPNVVPTDTRIVVNAPAYRMDLFENGTLVKSWRIAIGYPEFPLPVGLRRAELVSFNPTWTPPDEPWVEGSREVEAGKTVPAGSRLNPLGVAKIPIGLPSLIHGGKTAAQLGGFGSHGCVGLTDAQVRELALELARVTGAELTAAQVRQFGQDRKTTRDIRLGSPVPVELRYETIVVQDGAVRVFRDVYGYGTNTQERLAAVLSAHGASIDQLTPAERSQLEAAIREMAAGPAGPGDTTRVAPDTGRRAAGDSVTRTVKGRKEVVVPVAALAGKGYPAPRST